mmetsp:Transcript_61625/g.132490  ORF Transcript_61625/g.132490 Transcript_61625/m.132490 type:complete len:238 (-) Transcript_61625:75-788(-)
MAMRLRLLCIFLFLHLSIAAQFRHSGVRARQASTFPMFWPNKDLLEPGFSYSEPIGAGCKNQPEWTKTSDADTPAKLFNVEGWSGFCQLGWSLCPDAIANKDYNYYAKALYPEWVRANGQKDKEYCGKNGWLKPEFASIVHNFTALQAKGEELCKTKYAIPLQETLPVSGLDQINTDRMNEKDAHDGAAWNCALGDLSCDIAYCNYAYCEKSDGSFGMLEECEGWDKVHGMPLTRTS